MIDQLNQAIREVESDAELQQLAGMLLKASPDEARRLNASAVAEAYARPFENRYFALLMLSVAGGPEHLHELTELLVKDPPREWMQVGYVLSPLMQRSDWLPSAVFPRLLDGLTHRSVAGPALDLANYVTRAGRVAKHPATDHAEELTRMLAALVGGLAAAEKDPRSVGESVQEVQSAIAEGVAIIVSLCDALGLIGHQAAVGKLNQALQLTHRRIQTEAAGALARLGDEEGKKHLLRLAEEPAARLRVLAYAEELGCEEEVEEQYKSTEARGQAEVALWLSQPQQMGLPPSQIEKLDERRQFWPGFDSPVDCMLWRFTYDFGDSQLSNIAITGPVVHAFSADLAEVPIDDIYACFAGWHAVHDGIFEVPEAAWNAAQTRRAEALVSYLEQEGCDRVRPALLGIFLDEEGVAASVEREGRQAVAATDGLETVLYVTENRPRPLTPADVWNILKGRKMLRQFN